MNIKRTITAGTAVAATAALGVGLAITPATAKQGTAPLAGVLVDDNKFDNNAKDYDIVTEAVLAVLGDQPGQRSRCLTEGKRAPHCVRTAGPRLHEPRAGRDRHEASQRRGSLRDHRDRLPDRDRSSRSCSTTWSRASPSQRRWLPSPTVPSSKTAEGKRLTVVVKKGNVFLKDRAVLTKNAKVVQPNINKGNRQIAHGINGVLLPINLAG